VKKSRFKLDYCKDLGYIDQDKHVELVNTYSEITKMIISMRKEWKK